MMKKVVIVLAVCVFLSSLAFAGNVKVLDLRYNEAYFQVNDNANNDLELGENYTIEAWIYIDDVTQSRGTIMLTQAWEIRVVDYVGGSEVPATVRFIHASKQIDLSVPTEEWCHIAIQGSSEGWTNNYLNGSSVHNLGSSNITSETNFRIGKNPFASGSDFKGAIDEVRISNNIRYGKFSFSISKNDPLFTSDENTVLLFHFDDDALPPTNSSSKSFTITNYGITTDDYIAYNDASLTDKDLSLPVTLSSFTARAVKGNVVLEWETSAEVENQGFVLSRKSKVESQKSEIIADFSTDDALKGRGTTTETTKYAYTDKSVEPGKTYVYTLADVDYSGNETVLEKVEVKVEAEGAVVADGYALSPVYPNPFNASFTVPFTLNKSMNVTVDLFNINGRRVKSITNSSYAAGSHHLTVDADDLSSGTYIVRVAFDGAIHAQKIVLMK